MTKKSLSKTFEHAAHPDTKNNDAAYQRWKWEVEQEARHAHVQHSLHH